MEQTTTRRQAGGNFVAPEPATIQPYRAAIMDDPEYTHIAPYAPAQAEVMLRTTYKDRADGFIRATTPLAAVAGGITLVAAVGLFSVPVLSALALLWFFTGFALVWLAAYLAHLFISPDGATWLHAWRTWRVVEREQRFRHERYWTQYYDERGER